MKCIKAIKESKYAKVGDIKRVSDQDANDKVDKKYWKMPETWLNKESWNDEYSGAGLKSTNFIDELNSIAGEQLFKVIDTHYDKALLRCITIDHKEQALKLDSEIRKKIKEKIAEKYPSKALEVTY